MKARYSTGKPPDLPSRAPPGGEPLAIRLPDALALSGSEVPATYGGAEKYHPAGPWRQVAQLQRTRELVAQRHAHSMQLPGDYRVVCSMQL